MQPTMSSCVHINMSTACCGANMWLYRTMAAAATTSVAACRHWNNTTAYKWLITYQHTLLLFPWGQQTAGVQLGSNRHILPLCDGCCTLIPGQAEKTILAVLSCCPARWAIVWPVWLGRHRAADQGALRVLAEHPYASMLCLLAHLPSPTA